MSQAGPVENTEKTCISQESAAPGAAVGAAISRPDADLATILEAWPTLSNAIRRDILALARRSGD
jgi:hypothetical protein